LERALEELGYDERRGDWGAERHVTVNTAFATREASWYEPGCSGETQPVASAYSGDSQARFTL
jgi:hypothetical protein